MEREEGDNTGEACLFGEKNREAKQRKAGFI